MFLILSFETTVDFIYLFDAKKVLKMFNQSSVAEWKLICFWGFGYLPRSLSSLGLLFCASFCLLFSASILLLFRYSSILSQWSKNFNALLPAKNSTYASLCSNNLLVSLLLLLEVDLFYVSSYASSSSFKASSSSSICSPSALLLLSCKNSLIYRIRYLMIDSGLVNATKVSLRIYSQH